MYLHSTQRGQSLMELMLAIAVTTLGILAIGYLLFDGRASYEQQQAMVTARMLAYEGNAIAGALLSDDFNAVETGTYGVSHSSGTVSLIEGNDTSGLYSRTVTVTDVEESKKSVKTEVSWVGVGEVSKSIAIESYFTDWRQRSGDAQHLSVSGSVVLAASSTRIEGITIENSGERDITLSAIELTWEGGGGIQSVSIAGGEVWNAASSTAPIASGEQVDIEDVVLPQGAGTAVDTITMSDMLDEGDVLMTLLCEDGSMRYVRFTL